VTSELINQNTQKQTASESCKIHFFIKYKNKTSNLLDNFFEKHYIYSQHNELDTIILN